VVTDKRPLKKYPIVGACGLSCGLCPRYHTEGKSRCPGCCGPDFWEVYATGDGFITCCVREKKLETCAQCPDWRSCQRVTRNLEAAKRRDSFISYRPLADNFTFIEENGIEEFVRLEMEKQKLLSHLIENLNEGRSKGFYCLSCQLLPLDRLKEVVADAETEIAGVTDIKEKARIIRAAINDLAGGLNIELKLRK